MNILFKQLLQEGPMFKWSPLSDSRITYMSFNVPPLSPGPDRNPSQGIE